MSFPARVPALLAAMLVVAACRHPTAVAPAPLPGIRADSSTAAPLPTGPLQTSPRRLVGRIVAVDPARGFAFVTLTVDVPPAALADGADLIVRADDLRETGRLRVSPYNQGRTLGTKILAGQPSQGDEVVFQMP